MRRLTCLILICSLVPASPAANENSSARSRTRVKSEKATKFIVDTDVGVDDGIALLYLLGAEHERAGVKVVGITCVNGNTHLDNVAANVLKILKTANRLDVPVYKGANGSITVTPESGDYFGKDGFGDFHFPDPPPVGLVKGKHAVNAMIEKVKSRPGEISLLCLGPLTNVALAVLMHPNFLRDLKDLYVLGGTAEGLGNVKPGVEFNFFMDPEAASIVLKKSEEDGKEIVLMPWETVSLRGKISMDWRRNVLGTQGAPATELINKAEGKTLSGEDWSMGDPMLVAAAANGSLISSSRRGRMIVETCGAAGRGATFLDPSSTGGRGLATVIERMDMDAYKSLLLRYMAAARRL